MNKKTVFYFNRKNWFPSQKLVDFILEKTNEKQNIQECNNQSDQQHQSGCRFRIYIFTHNFSGRSQVNLEEYRKGKLHTQYHLWNDQCFEWVANNENKNQSN